MKPGARRRSTSEVFGISNQVRPDSYVDRGHLDELVGTALTRATHVALRGESKCGKSWLRQRILPDAVVVQCRLGKTSTDIYRDALSALESGWRSVRRTVRVSQAVSKLGGSLD